MYYMSPTHPWLMDQSISTFEDIKKKHDKNNIGKISSQRISKMSSLWSRSFSLVQKTTFFLSQSGWRDYLLVLICRLAGVIVPREGVRGVAGVASATPYFGHIGILK